MRAKAHSTVARTSRNTTGLENFLFTFISSTKDVAIKNQELCFSRPECRQKIGVVAVASDPKGPNDTDSAPQFPGSLSMMRFRSKRFGRQAVYTCQVDSV